MIPRLEAIRRYLGWCPATARACRWDAVPGNEGMNGVIAADSGRTVVIGAITDYGPVDVSAVRSVVMALAGIGLFTLIIYLSIAHPPSGSLLLLAIVLALTGVESYRVMRKTGIEITHDTIILRRPVLPAVIIPKVGIVKAEVRENRFSRLPWHTVVLVGIILASAVAGIYNSLSNPASMRFILGVATVIFFPAMMYCTRVRARYPEIMAITTADEMIATIYTDDPERIARMLGATR
ncbi:MAG: DUF1673 family protein [Methanomicrobiales archaeon]|nr:DUF1673 family protein [Methanomicrobiales archaeon]